MYKRIYLRLILIFGPGLAMCAIAHGQVAPTAQGGPGDVDEQMMMTPPPVSTVPFGNTTLPDARIDYLSVGILVTPAYIDNVLPSPTQKPIGDTTVSIVPTVSMNRTTPRQTDIFSYSPSFTFYEPTSSLNTIDQSAAATFQYRINSQASVIISDNFLRTSNTFNDSYPFSNPVTGSTLAPTPTVIAPFAEQMINTTGGELSYQIGRDAMVGGGASYSKFDLPNPQQAAGLYNSDTTSTLAFYSRRIERAQYLGLFYQYSRNLTYPTNETSEVQTHAILPFYTLYFNRVFSVSVAAGVQNVGISGNASPASNSWFPAVTASLGWQGTRGYLAASFFRYVTGGNGLFGALNSDILSGSGGWDLTQVWKASASISYSKISEVATITNATFTGGDALSGQVLVGRAFGERFNINFGYQHLNQNYAGIAAVVADPNSNREFGSVSYTFSKPMGR